jgi:hypothetical protein
MDSRIVRYQGTAAIGNAVKVSQKIQQPLPRSDE